MTRPLSFDDAKRRYPHRFTMEHVPYWARVERPDGTFYAPQYATDREWYDATRFPGEGELSRRACHCESARQTWPLGQSLDAPYQRRALA